MAAIPGIMVDIGANVARMQQDMRRLTGTMESGFGQMASMARKVAGALGVAFGVREIVRFGQEALELGDQMAKLSQSTGVSVENLSALKYAADLADVDIAGLAKGLSILSRNLFEAQGGSGEAKDAIKALGLTIENAQGGLLSSDKVMGQVADKFAAMEDGSAKTALAMRLFGKSGADLIPLLNQGSAEIAAMRAEAEKLGLIMSTETAQAMERVNDNFTRLKSILEGSVIRIVSGLVPTLENLTNILFDLSKEAGNFEETSKGIAATLKLVASGAFVAYSYFMNYADGVRAVVLALRELSWGNFTGAFEILESAHAQYLKNVENTVKTLGKIWDDGANRAQKGAEKIKKTFEIKSPVNEVVDPSQKALDALFAQAEAIQAGGNALELYKKGLHEATAEQKELATSLLGFIEAHEQGKKAIQDRIQAEEEDRKQIQETEKSIYDMVDSLKIQAVTAGMSEEETFKFQLALKGASQTLIENSDAYFRNIRAAKDYNEQIETLRQVLEDIKTPWEKHLDNLEKYQKLLESGMIDQETFNRAAAMSYESVLGKDKKTISEREQILLDFGDRFRKITLSDADYAIEQIERQAAIFRQAGADEVAVAIWASKEKQKASREWQDGAIRGLEEYASAATNAAKNAEEFFGKTFKTMEDALVDFVKTGKLDFKSLIDSILTDLLRLMIRQTITGPLASALSSGLGSLFSSGAGMASGSGLNVMGAGGAWGYAHEGKIIGPLSGMTKTFPAFSLAGAPRYHEGLQPDEFPTILKRGEGVFTPEQMKAMGGQTSISVNIPVNMNGGDTRTAGRLRRDLEGELEPVVRRIIERYA